MKKITGNKIINFLLSLYILSLYLFTYVEGLNVISNSILALFILVYWLNHIKNNKKIVFNNFLLYSFIFLLFSLMSVVVALDTTIAFSMLMTLVQIYVMMFTLVNYYDSIEKVYKTIKSFAISGLIATIYLFYVSDFSNITRFGDQLGNVNLVALMLSLSAVFGIVVFKKEKKYRYLLYYLLTVTMILLTGSRKGFLFILFSSALTFYSFYKINFKTLFPILLLMTIFAGMFYYIIINVELFYQILGRRVQELLLGFFSEKGTNEGSFNTRMQMINNGWRWFKDKPIFGHGINNYRVLSYDKGYLNTYSHNNFIELLVGIGIFGTISFYLSYLTVLLDVYRLRNREKVVLFSLLALIMGYVIMSFGLVFYYQKNIALILSMTSSLVLLLKSNKFIKKEDLNVRKNKESSKKS